MGNCDVREECSLQHGVVQHTVHRPAGAALQGRARAPPLVSLLSRAAKLEKLEAPEEQDANLGRVFPHR